MALFRSNKPHIYSHTSNDVISKDYKSNNTHIHTEKETLTQKEEEKKMKIKVHTSIVIMKVINII